MNILLCGSWDGAERDGWVQALRSALPARHRLLLARGEVDDAAIDAAIVANPPAGSLAGLTGLRLIQSLWAGVDRLLADATLPVDVPVARMVDPAMNAAMAETALWAVLSLHRGFFGYARQQQARQWLQGAQQRADEVPVLILGHGQMGRAAAGRIAQQGYPVAAWSREPARSDAPGGAGEVGAMCAQGVRRVHGQDALASAAANARIVVNLLPLTPDTRGVLGSGLFSAMPRGACLVNLARGGHLIEHDLLAALDDGHIGHVVLDVFDTEPLPSAHPFWAHPRVTVLPHVAAQTDLRSAAAVVVANIAALDSGAPIAHRVWRKRGY